MKECFKQDDSSVARPLNCYPQDFIFGYSLIEFLKDMHIVELEILNSFH